MSKVAKVAQQTKKPYKVKRYHISSKDREYLTGNLALLLKAGVAVGEGLKSLKETSTSENLKQALDQIQKDIDEGLSLWKALDRAGVVSEQTLALIELGENSGKLVDNMFIAAKQEEKQRVFRAKVRSALIYPSFVLGLTVVVGLGVAWFLLPKLSTTFDQLNIELPLISQILIGFGVFLQQNGIWAVPSVSVLVLTLIYILFAAPKTRHIGQGFLFHMPGIKRLLHEVEIAKFGYLLGTLLQAGLSVTQALELLVKATPNKLYKLFFQHLLKCFGEGYSFRDNLAKYKGVSKLLPPAVQQMIIAGERSGALPETLLNVGEIYEQKSDVTTQNLQSVLEPILLVIVWLGVMGVAVAVIIPIYSLVGGLEVQ